MKIRYVMGTILTVQIVGEDRDRLENIFFEEVQRLEDLLSIYRPESDIARINRQAGTGPVTVSPETCDVLQKALNYAELSKGAFDPTLQPFGYRDVTLDNTARTVFLAFPGMRLDLGAIGKGFALDLALARVKTEGSPQSVSANFGGQLLFWNIRGSFEPETILIEDPVEKGKIFSTFKVQSNCSISTSSNAERPDHLRDPRTGELATKSRSVTVVASSGTDAEAWSTALFVQGISPEGGVAWL